MKDDESTRGRMIEPALMARIGADPRVTFVVGRSVADCGAREGSLLLRPGEENCLVFVNSCGPNAAKLTHLRQQLDRGLVAYCFVSEKQCAFSEVQSDTRYDSSVDRTVGTETKSMLVSPVSGPHGPLGLLTAINLDAARLSDPQTLAHHGLYAWLLGTVVQSIAVERE